ncbi:hypothetical protein ACFYOK_04310 [Microbispora bryophytorum]|uniref:hypothetical protein n=1 Tax=Microbispora bryophytorum TaxID=1460882 RepID=UPI0033D60188
MNGAEPVAGQFDAASEFHERLRVPVKAFHRLADMLAGPGVTVGSSGGFEQTSAPPDDGLDHDQVDDPAQRLTDRDQRGRELSRRSRVGPAEGDLDQQEQGERGRAR